MAILTKRLLSLQKKKLKPKIKRKKKEPKQ
jgi:hypothetical protein